MRFLLFCLVFSNIFWGMTLNYLKQKKEKTFQKSESLGKEDGH